MDFLAGVFLGLMVGVLFGLVGGRFLFRSQLYRCAYWLTGAWCQCRLCEEDRLNRL